MINEVKFLTIRQCAATGILSEHALRLLSKQGKLPQITIGNRVLINYNKLVEKLNSTLVGA